MSQTDKAWEYLMDHYKILNEVQKNGYFIIKAKEIKKVREPRLMAKFDHYKQLPKPFKENDLSILPISRSSYIIGEFDVYEKVIYNQKIKPIQVDFPKNIESIDPTDLYSESSALHCAYITGMMDIVLGENSFHTISGRMSSKEFDYNIKTKKGYDYRINIKNSQVEIDGGYESSSQFMIVEAKNESVDDFLIRQLYYPYRLWQRKIFKEVKPVFFTYSNDIFSFFVYEFSNPQQYNSIKLVEQKDFIIAHEKISLEDIIEIFYNVKIVTEPKVPFPQADSFPRIVDLLSLLFDNDLSKDYITTNYDFDVRQTSYYTSAGIYLGLIEKYTDENGQIMFTLSYTGRKIMKQRTKDKFLSLVKMILVHKPFYQVLSEYFQTSLPPKKQRVVEIMKCCNLYNVNSDKTYSRRASTVTSWINWILDLPEIY